MMYLARQGSNLIPEKSLNKLPVFSGNWCFMDILVRLSRILSVLKFLLTGLTGSISPELQMNPVFIKMMFSDCP